MKKLKYIRQLFATTVSKTENFTGDGSTKAFTLSKTPVAMTTVTVGGTATTEYTQSGTTITFTTAPADAAAIVVTYTYDAGYDGEAYCDFSSNAAKAMAGKDILLAIWNADGTKILAISGQKSLTINRTADTVEVTSKDTDGGWKSYIPGMKEWSIDTDGIYVKDDESHKVLSAAFDAGDPVCIKVYDNKHKVGMFGGLACITDYPIEAPYDDSVTYSMTFTGMGKLVDLTINKPATDTLPA